MISGYNGVFRSDDDARAVYSEAAGIARVLPLAVAVPSSIEDVQALVLWARESGTPLIPRGSGSSMSGGAVGDGVIVDLSRMRYLGSVELHSNRIRVGPGVLCSEVNSAARAAGLRFPPDPSSSTFCTIGGMVSTNAAGPHTLMYGATRTWVSSLQCVFEDGSYGTVARCTSPPTEIPAVRRLLAITEQLRERDKEAPAVHAGVRKDASGYDVHGYAESYDLVDLLVGSEGTLAIVVGVELELIPVAEATSSLLGAFATLEDAVSAAICARDAGASACELLDRTFLDVAAQGATLPNIPEGTEAVLLAEVEGRTVTLAAESAKTLARTFQSSGATAVVLALSPSEEEALWQLRHAASPRLAALGPSLQSMQFVEDGAVPLSALPEYVRGVRRILQKYDVPGVIFGHAGDAHVHVNPLIDTARAGWRDTVRNILNDTVALTAQLNGTLTGEHGDGRLRTPLLGHVWPAESLSMFQMVKRAFDPVGIFNPGVKVALPNQRPIVDIKYDPALPALPPRAAAALASVARDQTYAQFRLDLLDQPS